MIKNFFELNNVKELQVFFGMFNYYGCYLLNLLIVLVLLYEFLGKDVVWFWGFKQLNVMQELKNFLRFLFILVYFDLVKKFVMFCDVLLIGLGVVLLYIIEEGEKLIVYVL